ncbi:zinc-ribbon domain-containing protein [Demequina globuliformis]|uniref:zinc-ribbon domain-containing protein n=1 Tax=Demequina globuliformis TaxID=676202 RepID=UPI0034E2306B
MCPVGHVLYSGLKRPQGRSNTDFYCNVCAGTRLVPGITSLDARSPTITRTWHPSLNGPVTPSDILPGSRRYFWWLCPVGHSWPATAASRTEKGAGCPYCAGTAIVQGEQDFATTHPHLVGFWDGTVEQPGPHQVSARNSRREIRLRCPSGHPFTRSPLRFALTPTCPYCEGRVLIPGRNDFATTHPHHVDWWHPTENNGLLPSDVRAGSNLSVTWLCPYGHDFLQAIGYMAKRRAPSCPICSGRKLRQGVNDAATRYPVITREWADDLNPVAANETVPGSGKWWWRCLKHGHELAMTVHERAHAGGCTDCRADDRVAQRFSVNASDLDAPPAAAIRSRVQHLQVVSPSLTAGAPALADHVWESIAAIVLEASPQAVVDRRKVVTAILYVLAHDLKWADTPRALSAPSTAWKWFHTIRLAGAWDPILDSLAPLPRSRA